MSVTPRFLAKKSAENPGFDRLITETGAAQRVSGVAEDLQSETGRISTAPKTNTQSLVCTTFTAVSINGHPGCLIVTTLSGVC